MLIKRLPADSQGVQPIAWRQSGSPIAAKESKPASFSAERNGLKEDQGRSELTAALHSRVAELETSLEQRCREARETGYRDGEAAGRTQANAQVQPLLEKLARSIQEIAAVRSKLRAEAESDLLKLSLAIARKILHRELSTDPDSIAGLIKVCLEKIRQQEIVRVRIHPQHHPAVQQLLARISSGVPIELLSDQKLQLGGVVIETARGEFDASVDLQLKEIERGLTDRLGGRA
jgi:flagellar assembly protein FliH